MDEWKQIGPEKGDYDADVQAVADALKYPERAVAVALTHRMTRQSLVLCLKDSMELITPVEGCYEGQWIYVSRAEYGAYWFRVEHKQDASYVAAKLDIHRVDAETIAEFLERLAAALGTPAVDAHSTVTQIP